MLVQPSELHSVGQRNLDHIKNHLGMNLPRSDIYNSQPVIGAQASSTNDLRTAEFILLSSSFATSSGCARQFHMRVAD